MLVLMFGSVLSVAVIFLPNRRMELVQIPAVETKGELRKQLNEN